jgi:uncharacterized protein YPO0396
MHIRRMQAVRNEATASGRRFKAPGSSARVRGSIINQREGKGGKTMKRLTADRKRPGAPTGTGEATLQPEPDRATVLRAKLEQGLDQLAQIHADVDRWEAELANLEGTAPALLDLDGRAPSERPPES